MCRVLLFSLFLFIYFFTFNYISESKYHDMLVLILVSPSKPAFILHMLHIFAMIPHLLPILLATDECSKSQIPSFHSMCFFICLSVPMPVVSFILRQVVDCVSIAKLRSLKTWAQLKSPITSCQDLTKCNAMPIFTTSKLRHIKYECLKWHSVAEGSVAPSQLQGSILSSGYCFCGASHFLTMFLRVLHFPPTSQKDACRLIGCSTLPLVQV